MITPREALKKMFDENLSLEEKEEIKIVLFEAIEELEDIKIEYDLYDKDENEESDYAIFKQLLKEAIESVGEFDENASYDSPKHDSPKKKKGGDDD